MYTYKIPSIGDKMEDLIAVFSEWEKILTYIQTNNSSKKVIFDFTECQYISYAGVACMGGIIRYIQSDSKYGFPIIKWETASKLIMETLKGHGFTASFAYGTINKELSQIVPYREDKVKDSREIMNYLKQSWLGPSAIHLSQKLRDSIVGRVWEIYENAFEHSGSPVGVVSCGQKYGIENKITLTVLDFGRGIPTHVNNLLGKNLSSEDALKWAFQSGNTTKILQPNQFKNSPGGLGLDLLKQFIYINKGKMEVFSNDGYALIEKRKEVYSKESQISFSGTLINIVFMCDDNFYYMESEEKENMDAPLF